MSRHSALLVGIDNYTKVGDLSHLHNCRKDADRLATLLSERCFFRPPSVISTDTSADRLRTQINEFIQDVKDDDVVLFYFAGHGLHVNGRTYLIAQDGGLPEHFEDFRSKAFQTNSLVRRFRKCRGTKVFLFDCCRNQLIGSAGERYQVEADEPPPKKAFRDDEIIIYATTIHDVASDVAAPTGPSATTGAFMDALNKAMENAGQPFWSIWAKAEEHLQQHSTAFRLANGREGFQLAEVVFPPKLKETFCLKHGDSKYKLPAIYDARSIHPAANITHVAIAPSGNYVAISR